MGTRVPASMRSRQQLSDLIEGRLSSADGRAELIKLATRLIVSTTPTAARPAAVIATATGGVGCGRRKGRSNTRRHK